MQAVILAGGKGRRLLPYTTLLPKPLMPIGDYSILEIILKQLVRSGFHDIIISTGYLGELIQAFLKERQDLDIPIRFSHETVPLGTIGPLHLIHDLEDSFLVMNGDILTDLDYQKVIAYHQERTACATIATYQRDSKIDFGVLEKDSDNKIYGFREKPVYHFDVSMGVYILQKEILKYVPDNKPFGFDDLMYVLISNSEAVYSYPHDGYWLDIGRPDDYERAIREFDQISGTILK
jgi:NDP-sugar pyrophosphorylase family protein